MLLRLDGQVYGNGLYVYGLLGHATDRYVAEAGIQMTVQIGARRYVVAGPFTSTYLGQSQ
jgi:hypothetical protein